MSEPDDLVYRVSLIIADFEVEPDAVTRTLLVAPTKVWRKGELVTPNTLHRHHWNGWLWKLPEDPGVRSLDDSVHRLFDVTAAWLPRLERIEFAHVRQVAAVIKATAARALLGLSAPAIERLAGIRAELDLDYYEYWPPEE